MVIYRQLNALKLIVCLMRHCVLTGYQNLFARRARVIETITNKILQYEYQCYETIGQLPKVFLPLKKFTHLMCLKTSFVKGNVEM